jgi:serine/threonine protein kinase
VGEKIGAGGFGVVFRAEQIALGRAVAVKVFRPTPGNDSALALDRFRREGMTACRVNHPNAIQIHDSGISSDGIPYLVMELLDGHPLTAEVERGALSAKRAIAIATAMCEALAAAHAAGIVHRDIKPDNVFLGRGERGDVVKLLDFGIAKLMNGDGDSVLETGTLSAVGTPRYMAPERLTDAGRHDARSDVYSVGIVLYEMLSGGSPWPGTSDVFGMITSIVTGKITPLETIGVPDVLARLVQQALAPDANERPTATELARRLEETRARMSEAELARTYGRTSLVPAA